MSNDILKVKIDKETNTLRRYTLADEARSILNEVFELGVVLDALREHEQGGVSVLLSDITDDEGEYELAVNGLVEEFGSYQQALEDINLTDAEVNHIIQIYKRWETEGEYNK